MNTNDAGKRNIGIHFTTEGTAQAAVWAPLAEKVSIVVKGGEANIPLLKTEWGFWEAENIDIKENDLYKISIDGNKELPDPASLCQPDGVHGFSKAININSFDWTDGDWKNTPLEEYILYELHTGVFTAYGTFAAIEEKLDYLKELGINAIEIMPVAQFAGDRNWGYDGVFPFAVQSSYGGAEGLQRLVQACHQKGFAVILDVVYNHVGPEGNYLGEFAPYFTSKYHTPWGNAINFDDEWCDGVRQFYIENVLMWFRDFHIDALRLDAVHAIKDFSPVHILRGMKQHVNELMTVTGKTHYLIVEQDLNDNRFINPLHEQGFGIDAQWMDEFHHALRVAAGETPGGYYSDFNGLAHLAKSYKDAYVYDGQYSAYRKKKFGTKADNPGKQFIVFSQNHDQVGNRLLGERSSALVSFEMQKLMAAAVIASPYLPMLFMGEEYGELHPFLYFVSHTDPQLAEAVRQGRKAEFTSFHMEGEAPDPVAESTFHSSKLQWDLVDREPHKTLLQYYKTLIATRKNEPALSNLNRGQLSIAEDVQNQTLLLHRWHEGEHVVCLMNFSKQPRQLALPDYKIDWKKLINSADPVWRGSHEAPDTIAAGELINLQPEAVLIYKCVAPVSSNKRYYKGSFF